MSGETEEPPRWLQDALMFLSMRAHHAGPGVAAFTGHLLSGLECDDFVAPGVLVGEGGALVLAWRRFDRGLDVRVRGGWGFRYTQFHGLGPHPAGRSGSIEEGEVDEACLDRLRGLVEWFRSGRTHR